MPGVYFFAGRLFQLPGINTFVCMKFWAMLLSMYVMLLAALPCCAFDNCPDDKAVTEQSHEAGHEKGDEDGCGTCSPFFNCNTCSSCFIAPVVTDFISAVDGVTASVFNSHYTSAIPESLAGNIWQPPKLA